MAILPVPTSGLWADIAALLNTNQSDTISIKTVLQAESFATQTPTGLDTPLPVEFGFPAITQTGEITIDAAGAITVVTSGVYLAQLSLQVGRTTTAGVAYMLTRSTVDGVQFGDSSFYTMDDSSTNVLSSSSTPLALTAGQVFRVEVARDSAGVNNGQLESFTPSGVLTAAGWLPAASAEITVTKFFTNGNTILSGLV